jgi:hypothetical protein
LNAAAAFLLAVALLAAPAVLRAAEYLDIAPFAQRISAESSIGLEWDEERDVRELRIQFAGEAAKGAAVEYWFESWPWDPPSMPSIEDPTDDPWRGNWLKAAVAETCTGTECRYEFGPLATAENPRADRLPGVRYRRTLKVRVVWNSAKPAIQRLQAFSGTEEIPIRMRVEARGRLNSRSFSIYNGRLLSVNPSGNSAALEVMAAKPSLPGSHDLTVITVRPEGGPAFSFCTSDLARGPIAIPALHARVADDAHAGQNPGAKKTTIRERIPLEPEQTLERASREIPPLDPWERESGGKLYLPLAADSSWQKFAFELGGDVFLSKSGTKAKGRELARLQWNGDTLRWRFGTGSPPYYREDRKVSLHNLAGFLPAPAQEWDNEGLHYTEEAYATLLRGPLSPEDPARDEETPAVLMVRLTARNSGATQRDAHVSISDEPAEVLTVSGSVVSGDGKVRAEVDDPAGSRLEATGRGIDVTFSVQPGHSTAVIVKLPFVSDVPAADLQQLDYAAERTRVVDYWTRLVAGAERFRVPEAKFNNLARGVVAHIHISTTKDPATGLYIVPAASYGYDVFENEAAYQVQLLDTLGQSSTAAEYLETMLRLQGSKNFPGLQTGPFDAVFHGEKISDAYDYTTLSGYGLDHGTVLWTLAQHYLYTRDRAWLAHAWPRMKKAIDWIVEHRTATKRTDVHGAKVREFGLLPASQLEDNPEWENWFVINAYAWAGMARTAEALADAGNPEAAQVRGEADAYLADLRDDIQRAIESAPVVRTQDGTYEPYVPVLPTRRFRIFGPIRRDYYQRYGRADVNPLMRLGADRDTLCGPVLLLLLGVFDVHEPMANWILNDWEDNETLSSGMGMNVHGMTDDRYWFSQGGMVFQANLVNPIPVYLRLHEAPAAIRALYNDFVACIYPEANAFTEEYHQWKYGSGPFYKISDEARFTHRLRDMLVLEDGGTLWLAPGAPRRWVASREGIRVSAVRTFFGPVSYTLHAGANPGTIEGEVTLPSLRPPKSSWLVVRTPSKHILSVTLNGQPWTRIDTKLEAIELPHGDRPLRIEVRYR